MSLLHVRSGTPTTDRGRKATARRLTAGLLGAVVLAIPIMPLAQQSLPLPDASRPGASPLDRSLPGFKLPKLPGQIIDVPPVYNRPLAVEEGPKIYVKSFVIAGLPDEAQHGVNPGAIRAMVERQRIERQGLSLQDQDLSKEDLRTIAKYYEIIAGGRKEADRLRIYQALIRQIRDRVSVEQNKGLTFGQLQQIADTITKHYREAGYFLATAIVPQQTVEDGVVEIQVLEGKLGKVLVSGNERFRDKTVRAPFEHLVGEPVTQAEIESALLTLTDYPGLTAFGVFQQGENVGETDLSIQVQDELVNEPNFNFDNHGNETTGEYRARIDYARNNVFGFADRFEGSLLAAFDPENTLFGSFNYSTPFIWPDYRVGIGATHNTFDVGGEFEDADVSGVTTNANLFVRKQFQRGRETNLYGLVDFAVKRAETLIQDEQDSQDRLSVLTLELGYDFVDKRFAGLNQLVIQYAHGFGDLLGSLEDENDPDSSRRGDSARAGGRFDKLTASFFRLQSITQNHSLFVRFSLQASDDLLVPLEQSSLGGPDNVRGYPVGQVLRDNSAFGSLEWSMTMPFIGDQPAFRGLTWAQVLRLSLFYDYGWGDLTDPLDSEEEEVTLTSAGIGATLTVEDQLFAKLDIAWPISEEEPENGREPQYWFNLSYAF